MFGREFLICARLGESIALQDGAAECDLEELLDLGAQGRAAADHEAQAPAEALLQGVDQKRVKPVLRLRGFGSVSAT